jgi:CRISPR-associated endonuclease Csn1
LVYVPTSEERKNKDLIDFANLSKEQVNRIWNLNDFSGETIYFTPNRLAKSIIEKEVDLKINQKTGKLQGSFDTKTASIGGMSIKSICWKLKINRLGKITGYEK